MLSTILKNFSAVLLKTSAAGKKICNLLSNDGILLDACFCNVNLVTDKIHFASVTVTK
jgi:hypothetical protein